MTNSLHYYQARYYDATLNRFIQPDSIIPNLYNPQSLNRYSYVQNNPVRYTDPTGHCPFCIVGAIGGFLGGAIYGYGSQVVNNFNHNGGDLGNALTTNIDAGQVVKFTVAGTVIGGTLGVGIELVAPLFTAATAAEAVTTVGGAAATCAETNCEVKAAEAEQTAEEALPMVEQAVQDASDLPAYLRHYMDAQGYAGSLADNGLINSTKGVNFLTNGLANDAGTVQQGVFSTRDFIGYYEIPTPIGGLEGGTPIEGGTLGWNEWTTTIAIPVTQDQWNPF